MARLERCICARVLICTDIFSGSLDHDATISAMKQLVPHTLYAGLNLCREGLKLDVFVLLTLYNRKRLDRSNWSDYPGWTNV